MLICQLRFLCFPVKLLTGNFEFLFLWRHGGNLEKVATESVIKKKKIKKKWIL